MVLLTDIVENEIVSKINNKLRVKEVVSTIGTDITIVKFCDNKWLSLYAGQGAFGSINSDGSVSVNQEPLLQVGDIVELPIPIFRHGTPLNTVEEWSKYETVEQNKLPLIWLVTPYTERVNDYNQVIERNCDVKLFFIHTSDWLNSLNEGRVNQSVKPLAALVDEFERAINANRGYFGMLKKTTRKHYPKFGTEQSDGSTKTTIFNSTLAAIELKMTLDVKKSQLCEC